MKLFSCQDNGDFAVINIDDRIAFSMISKIDKKKQGPRLIKYGLDREKCPSVWYEDGQIYYDIGHLKSKIDISGSLLRGEHNMSNAAASAAASLIMGADPGSTGTAIKKFKPLSHRMEYLGEVSGIRCINDSKSTNPDASIAALKDFSKEVTIIMGGLDKDMDFIPVIPSLISTVNNIILIGRSAPRMQRLFSSIDDNIGIYICNTLEEAVARGFEVTGKGDVLLLSPGCASMDMFENYKDRGDRFKKAVMSLRHGS
jgi:UDP-N-acetylmuramoylalanine--D-glutamate ligase